jgi:hypothetical protein
VAGNRAGTKGSAFSPAVGVPVLQTGTKAPYGPGLEALSPLVWAMRIVPMSIDRSGSPSSPLVALIRGETPADQPEWFVCLAYTYFDSCFKFEIVQNKKIFKFKIVQNQKCSKPKMFKTKNIQI